MSETEQTESEQKSPDITIGEEEYAKYKLYQERKQKMAELRKLKKSNVETSDKPKKRVITDEEKHSILTEMYSNNDSASNSVNTLYNKIKDSGKSLISKKDIKEFLTTQKKQRLVDKSIIPPSFNRHVSKAVDTAISTHLGTFKDEFTNIVEDFKKQFATKQDIPKELPKEEPPKRQPLPSEFSPRSPQVPRMYQIGTPRR